jgi:hypothetical protein
MELNDTSVGGNYNVFANTTTSTTIEHLAVGGQVTFLASRATEDFSTHSLNALNSVFGGLTVDFNTYFDTQSFTNTVVYGNIDLKSNGSIILTNITATDASLNSRKNVNSALLINGGSYQNLMVQSGDPTDHTTGQEATIISITSITVNGVLTISPDGRLKQGTIAGPITTKLDYNSTGAEITISGGTIGTLSMPRAAFESDTQEGFVAFGPAAAIALNIYSATIQTVDIRLPNSDDEMRFSNVLVQQSTTLHGGGFYPENPPSEEIGTGRNVLTKNGGSLANLTQTNFIFVQNP